MLLKQTINSCLFCLATDFATGCNFHCSGRLRLVVAGGTGVGFFSPGKSSADAAGHSPQKKKSRKTRPGDRVSGRSGATKISF
uniref:Uncharacterized protein n=1 Tax=Chelativorans sp. (strain BNC1) TaxID=266779 RepID=Q11H33_CHESB